MMNLNSQKVIKKKILAYLIGIFAMICSCNNEPIENIRSIDFNNFDKEHRVVSLSEVADSVKYIVLELTSESLIGKVSKSCIGQSHILIYDEILEKVLLFDIQGNFLTTISNKGPGPTEYIAIQDIDMDEDSNRILLTTFGSFVKVFSLDGVHKLTMFNGKYPSVGRFSNSESCFLYIPYPKTVKTKGDVILKYDLYNNKFQPLFWRPIVNVNQSSPIGRVEVYQYFDTLSILEHNYDTIWGITKDDKVIPRWQLKHSNRYLDDKKYRQGIFPDDAYQFDYHFETTKFFLFSGINRKAIARIFYKKSTKKFISLAESDPEVNSLQRFGFRNDIDGGFPFWPYGQKDENWLYTTITHDNLKQAILSNPSNKIPDWVKIELKSEEVGNPIFVLVKFKN